MGVEEFPIIGEVLEVSEAYLLCVFIGAWLAVNLGVEPDVVGCAEVIDV